MNDQEKFNYYFNAAKNDGADFTQSELERIVETAPNNKSGLSNYSINKWTRKLIMTTLGLTLMGTLAGIWLWFGASVTTSPKQKLQAISQSKSPKQSVINIPTTKSLYPKTQSTIPRKVAIETTHEQPKAEIPPKIKTLNIEGVTSIALQKDELTKLGITSGNDCGITVLRYGLSTTYYNLTHYNKINYYNPNHQKSPLDSMMEANGNLHESSDTNEMFTSVTSMGLGEKPDSQSVLPLLITSLTGHILSDGLGSRISNEENTLVHKDIDSLHKNNPENKPTMIFYLYPSDSSMTEQEIQQFMGDTTDHLTVFKRLTQADVEQMKKNKEIRTKKINEYLRLNKLVAVKAESDCPNNTLVFWYELTEEFIRHLPVQFQAGLRKDMIDQHIQVPDDKLHTGCLYSDICRATSGAVLETSVFPTPAYDKMNLRFVLNEARDCTFSLHDLNGIFIKELGTKAAYSKGEHTFIGNLNEVNSGVYLLSMITDKGERIVQRVIVKK